MKKSKFPVKVTSKFLNKLADQIYNPSTKEFLRLCDGTLQNGPDPDDQDRPMHCGLGELYFAMTGRQPKQDHVNEYNVVEKAIELSAFNGREDRQEAQYMAKIRALKLPQSIEKQIFENCHLSFEDGLQYDFKNELNKIPYENDDGCKDNCSLKALRARSSRVAKVLRRAAKILAKAEKE